MVRPDEPMGTVLPWQEGGWRDGSVEERPVRLDQVDFKAVAPFADAAAILEAEV